MNKGIGPSDATRHLAKLRVWQVGRGWYYWNSFPLTPQVSDTT